MLKIEYIWRELLYQVIEKGNPVFTITELAKRFRLSTSVVSHALYPLKELQIVRVRKTRSVVLDVERLLMFWATRRNVRKEIVYQTYSPMSVFEREGLMPADVFPTAYSALRLYYQNTPADYETIYFYSDDIQEIKKRFPQNVRRNSNIFILKKDPYLSGYKKTPLAQIYTDLWNLPEWYAKEFLEAAMLEIKKKVGL